MWAWTPRIVEVKLLEKHTMDMYEHVVVVATEQGTRGRGHLRSCSATGRPPLRTMHIMFAKMYTRAEFVRVIEEEGLVDVHREMRECGTRGRLVANLTSSSAVWGKYRMGVSCRLSLIFSPCRN